jgi:thiol-disulfide isomerase/thioredoxin
MSGTLAPIHSRTLQGDRYVPPIYHGDVLVMNFWNPYCTPCRKEATTLDLALGHLSRARLVGYRVTFLGVLFSNANFPHDTAAARRFARELGERYPTIDDPGGRLADRLDIRGIPTTVIADESGRLRFQVLGAVKPGQIERLIRRALRR